MRLSTAGASSSTMAAASATALVSPTPNCLMIGSPLRMKLANTDTMISAAAVIMRALAPSPCAPRVIVRAVRAGSG